MEYYYSGTESVWCWNWNHLVCRKLKCEINHPSQSTVVNLGKKQKWCFMWCPWSQWSNFVLTIHHRCKWDWTEMLFLSLWEQRLYEFLFVWIQKDVVERKGAICTNWNAEYLLEDLSGQKQKTKHENIINQKLEHLDVIFRVLVFRIRVLLYKISFFVL